MATTPLLPTFEKRISDAADQILRKQIDPWFFMPQGLSITRFDGSPISYSGVKFDGSPRLVFWSGYIEPFLENLIISEISAGVAMARERGVDARLLLPEIQGLLSAAIAKIYERMALADQRLRGEGEPERIRLRNTQPERDSLASFASRHVQAELAMWHPKSPLERWYSNNKALAWAIGAVLTAAGVVAAFL